MKRVSNNVTPFDISGKTILVTGASSGIGKNVAIECAKLRAKVIITGRNKEKLNQTLVSLEGESHQCYDCDLTNEEELNNFVSKLSNVDGIVHCAGIANPKPFSFVNKDDINEIMSINFFAPTFLTNEMVKKKKINKGASIVFISSISGNLCTYFGNSIYSASKSAINGLVKGIALDLAKKQIRVNSIMPGMIDTGILNASDVSKEDLEADKKKYPLGRYGNPEEVAYSAIYLLSNASSWMTGTNLLIDGGYTLL